MPGASFRRPKKEVEPVILLVQLLSKFPYLPLAIFRGKGILLRFVKDKQQTLAKHDVELRQRRRELLARPCIGQDVCNFVRLRRDHELTLRRVEEESDRLIPKLYKFICPPGSEYLVVQVLDAGVVFALAWENEDIETDRFESGVCFGVLKKQSDLPVNNNRPQLIDYGLLQRPPIILRRIALSFQKAPDTVRVRPHRRQFRRGRALAVIKQQSLI